MQVDGQAVHQRHLFSFGSCNSSIISQHFTWTPCNRKYEPSSILPQPLKALCSSEDLRQIGFLTHDFCHHLLQVVFCPGPRSGAQHVSVRAPVERISLISSSVDKRDVLERTYILAHLSSSSWRYPLTLLGCSPREFPTR